jgi:hypothetical protein
MKLKFISSFTSALLLAGIIGISSCSKSKEAYSVHLLIPEKAKQDSLLVRIVTIIEEHMPDSVEKGDRFKPEQQTFFKSEMNKYKFEYLYKDDKGDYCYYISKPAYGVPELSVGLAGKFKLDDQGNLSDFEESYRMFRMTPEELDKKKFEVYESFVEGKDLASFHRDPDTDPYIEFPNDHVGYDKKKMEWYLIKPY